MVWFEYTTEIKEYRQIYEKHIDVVLLFKNNLRKAIFEYYSKTKWLISLLEADERRKIVLTNKSFSLTKDIMNSKNISEEEAKKSALIELKNEDEEFKRININIKSNLDKFISMKQDAKKIIEETITSGERLIEGYALGNQQAILSVYCHLSLLVRTSTLKSGYFPIQPYIGQSLLNKIMCAKSD